MKIKKFTTRNLFLCLFAILYLSVAAVSTFHAFHFFGLANNSVMAAMLAGTFEIGQAAVLFSLLTDSDNRKKYMPWVLMCILTLVQVLGNVFSSYEYIITNSMDSLRYFKEPIFIWTNLPDEQANVIVTYIQGSLLPIVCLLLTSMVTSYLSKEENNNLSNEQLSNKPEDKNDDKQINNQSEKTEELSKENTKIEDSIEDKPEEQIESISLKDEKKDEETVEEEPVEEKHQQIDEEPIQEEIVKEEPIKEKPIKEEPVQQTQQIETPLDLQNEQHKSSKPSHFINL